MFNNLISLNEHVHVMMSDPKLLCGEGQQHGGMCSIFQNKHSL